MITITIKYEIIGMGACLADGAKVRVTAKLNEDVAKLLPYVNAVIKYASFNPGQLNITFKYQGCTVILEKQRVVVGQLNDLDEAEDILEDLMVFLNQVQSKMGQITPLFQPKIQAQPQEIIKLLPRTNCGQCGETTCTAFALKLVLDQQKAENCLLLSGDEIRKVLSILESLSCQQLIID